MKQPGMVRRLVFLITLILIVVLGLNYSYFMKKVQVSGKGEILKEFDFSSAKSLREWDKKVLSQKSTSYTAENFDGKSCVKAYSEDSASALFYKQTLSCKREPFLKWKWRPEVFPVHKQIETLYDKGEFDFVAQVYVVFSAKFFLNAKALQYVWTEDLPVGTVAPSPYTKNVKVVVLQSGASEEWKEESRNLKEDFRNFFGMELEKDIDAVAIMTDADSTGSTAIAYYTDIVFGYLENNSNEGSVETVDKKSKDGANFSKKINPAKVDIENKTDNIEKKED
ncbi:MAG: DUF3047 domain-containing protein [Candidatus Omnitrophota bacterium]